MRYRAMVRGGLGLALAWAGTMPASAQEAGRGPALTAFASDEELRTFLRRAIDAEQRDLRAAIESGSLPLPPPPPPPPPSPAAAAAPSAPAAPNITNSQVANVDEGDIVKAYRDMLVVLRRGRLFTVSLAGGTMRAGSSIDAFPPGVDARGDWYDEMLVAGDRVIVVGYSYARGGTQVNRFRIDAAGGLAFEDGYQLRSNDYYSSRNYATRLIGNRLILYSPLTLHKQRDPLESLPGMRRWQAGAAAAQPFRRIVGRGRVYIPQSLRNPETANISTLHSVTSCDLTAPVLDCAATVVLGSDSRTFFVSTNAVYLWIDEAWRRGGRADHAFIYRMPFDGGAPSAVAARGGPVDQFAFLADPGRSMLHVVVRAEGGGDAMWRPEASAGDVALLSIPTALFGSGNAVPLRHYRSLPRPKGAHWSFHNRFVGDTLLYGTGAAGDAQPGAVYAVPLDGETAREIALTHAVDRIEAMGRDAMVVGAGPGFLGFSAIALGPDGARLGESFALPDAAEGESRSHAFFFRPDPGVADGASGLLGLPVARAVKAAGDRFLGNSAAILFLDRHAGRLARAGELAASGVAGEPISDGCQASCVDWYGNARPIFIGERIFALLGYEIVEGRARDRRIAETGRVSFAPAGVAAARE